MVGRYSLALGGGGGDKIVMVCDGMGYKKIPALQKCILSISTKKHLLVVSGVSFFLPSGTVRAGLVWPGRGGKVSCRDNAMIYKSRQLRGKLGLPATLSILANLASWLVGWLVRTMIEAVS